jgi:RNA polymerase sigma-70 factor (ECF subfamily)
MDLSDDKRLAARMCQGEPRAFDEFFNGYFDRLYRFALVRLNQDADAAEDVVQQTLTRAVQKISLYRGESALFTWLCRICRNTIVDSFRAAGRAQRETVPFEDNEEVRLALESISAMTTEDPAVCTANDQLRRLVRVVLDYLPRRYGQVLEWKYIEDLSVKDIAVRLGVAPKAAESMLTRARSAFREGIAALGLAGSLPARFGEGH